MSPKKKISILASLVVWFIASSFFAYNYCEYSLLLLPFNTVIGSIVLGWVFPIKLKNKYYKQDSK
jgi:hypothetical protein